MSEELKPGRELDAEIATRVFGWTDCDPSVTWKHWEHGDPGDRWTDIEEPWCRGTGKSPDGFNYTQPFPRYSEDIADAWQVVERLKGIGSGVNFWVTNRFVEVELHAFEAKIRGETFPHAICIAALEAVVFYEAYVKGRGDE